MMAGLSHAPDPVRPAHRSAERGLGYALSMSSFEGWKGLSFILAARLGTEERAAIAWAALGMLPADRVESVVSAALGGAGMPLPALQAPMDEARWWAEWASRPELKAWCLASFEALPAADQLAFLAYVQRREAA